MRSPSRCSHTTFHLQLALPDSGERCISENHARYCYGFYSLASVIVLVWYWKWDRGPCQNIYGFGGTRIDSVACNNATATGIELTWSPTGASRAPPRSRGGHSLQGWLFSGAILLCCCGCGCGCWCYFSASDMVWSVLLFMWPVTFVQASGNIRIPNSFQRSPFYGRGDS